MLAVLFLCIASVLVSNVFPSAVFYDTEKTKLFFHIAASAYGNQQATNECVRKINPIFGINAQYEWHSLDHCSLEAPCSVIAVIIPPEGNKKGELVIAFEGTNNYSKLFWQAVGANMMPLADFYGKGKVNSYYLNALTALWTYIEVILKKYPDHTIAFTGHSKGGAVAAIAAFYCALFCKSDTHKKNIQLHTFGEPRHGNPDYAMNHGEYVPRSVRYVNGSDGIAHLPMCDISRNGMCDVNNPNGFFHQGHEFWFNKGMDEDPVICGPWESMKCSNQLVFDIQLLLNPRKMMEYVSDHQIYFGKWVYYYGRAGCPNTP
ncbi:lipase (class 3) domain-containing protein [Ditylenchus destructor]|uniref:Lipase (Class 3) domain-containing protein n=1 Tax=Ditylenchus destructor TaxID=166010 RepID=A0AAD4R9B4_9BILA|nr:lipase (class 3) domain-containing protein [Ditylenchus destructor]